METGNIGIHEYAANIYIDDTQTDVRKLCSREEGKIFLEQPAWLSKMPMFTHYNIFTILFIVYSYRLLFNLVKNLV